MFVPLWLGMFVAACLWLLVCTWIVQFSLMDFNFVDLGTVVGRVYDFVLVDVICHNYQPQSSLPITSTLHSPRDKVEG